MSGTAIGLIAVAMWVLTTLLFAYISTVPPLQLVALVFFFGYIAMTISQIIKKEDISSYWQRPISDYIFWLSTAGLYTILLFMAFRFVQIFEANILNYLWPILLIIFAAVINKERVTVIQVLGGLIGFVGCASVFLPSNGVPLFEDFHTGHALSLIAAILWPLYSIFAKRRSYPVGFLGPVFLIFSLICLVLHIVFEQTVMPKNYEWLVIVTLGVLRVSYVFWDYGMKHGDVIFLASASYFLPLFSSLGLIFLGFGPLRESIAIGAAMIILGCLIVNYDHLKLLLRRWEKTA